MKLRMTSHKTNERFMKSTLNELVCGVGDFNMNEAKQRFRSCDLTFRMQLVHTL